MPTDPVRLSLGTVQSEVFNDPTQNQVVIAGRRLGKTVLAKVRQGYKALKKPHSLLWYIAPTFEMAEDIAWEPYKEFFAPWTVKVNESRLRITLLNGSTIQLKGADKPKRLVGRGLDDIVLDEFGQMESAVWDKVSPALTDKQGTAFFITSPEGMNWAYDLYLRGQEGRPDWKSWQFTTLQGGRVAEEELARKRATMDPRLFRQEFEASFEALTGRVYSNFSRALYPDGNIDPNVTDLGGDLLVGLDFNVHPMSAVLACKAGDEPHIFDEMLVPSSNTEEVAQEIRRRYPSRLITVYPDPSGKSRRTSAPAGQTDFTILERHGMSIDAPAAAPPVVDRVNNTQAVILTADGRRRLRVHPRCMNLIRAFEGHCYKEGTSIPDKKSGLDHITDAAGYLFWQEFNLLEDREWTTFSFKV